MEVRVNKGDTCIMAIWLMEINPHGIHISLIKIGIQNKIYVVFMNPMFFYSFSNVRATDTATEICKGDHFLE